jgi:hypothetical protein
MGSTVNHAAIIPAAVSERGLPAVPESGIFAGLLPPSGREKHRTLFEMSEVLNEAQAADGSSFTHRA